MSQTCKCIKSLFKSTYKRNAFTRDMSYEIASKDSEIAWVKDNLGNEFSFSVVGVATMYNFFEYFTVKT